jgi:hypothetical protein
VGVNLKSNYLVRYTFDETQGLSASDFQYATIGFSTKVKQGILMQMRSEETPDYISVEMNNNGNNTIAWTFHYTQFHASVLSAWTHHNIQRLQTKQQQPMIKTQYNTYTLKIY